MVKTTVFVHGDGIEGTSWVAVHRDGTGSTQMVVHSHQPAPSPRVCSLLAPAAAAPGCF